MTDDDNMFVLPVSGLGDVLPSPMTYEIATLRDQFAMAALPGVQADIPFYDPAAIAARCYALADAMMEARK